MNSIPVVHHLECNVVPLKILISLEFIHALIDFFDPEALRAKKDEEVRKQHCPLCVVVGGVLTACPMAGAFHWLRC